MSTTVILALIPLVAIQIGLQIFALYDIYRNKGARPTLPTWLWVLVILFGEFLGVIIYFLFGRKEDEED